MKCQILFSWKKNKKNIINMSSAELAQREVKVKPDDSNVARWSTAITTFHGGFVNRQK